MPLFPAQGAGPQGADTLGQVAGDLGKLGSLGRGEVVEGHPVSFQADLFQDLAGVGHPPLGAQITFQVMAGALQSAGHEDAVGSPLEGVQDV